MFDIVKLGYSFVKAKMKCQEVESYKGRSTNCAMEGQGIKLLVGVGLVRVRIGVKE